MDIIREHAEKRLYEYLSAAARHAPGLRCIHFKQARSGHAAPAGEAEASESDGPLSAFVEVLKDYMHQPEARLFLCHDGDVFVVAQNLTQHYLNGFLHHLEAKLGPASFMGLAYLFEVGVDWPKLRIMCERKFQTLKRGASLNFSYVQA